MIRPRPTSPCSFQAERPVRHAIINSLPIVLAALPIAAARAPAQEPVGRPASVTVYLPDWHLNGPAEIRSGRIGVIHEAEGPRVEVYWLADTVPPVFPVRVRSEVPALIGKHFVVADFVSGNRNRLGGFFNAFQRAPSAASAALASAPDGRSALRLSYTSFESGFGGLWIHLFDDTSPPDQRVYLDARSFATLSLWVRGEQGGERVLLKLADADWESRGDAIPVGELGELLPSGRVEPEWQLAVVHLDRLSTRIDRSALASLVLEAIGPAQGSVFISQVVLSVGSNLPPSLPDLVPSVPVSGDWARATWVWNTEDILENAEKRDSTLSFLGREDFDVVFLQLVNAPGDSRPLGEIEPDPRLRDFVGRLTGLGIRVYALDGYARYAQPEFHPRVLATIRNVVRYNTESREEEKFFGVRYDIEPYLLPGFHGPRRTEILIGYLDLLARGADVAHQGELAFGVDIPFWFDAPDETTFERVTVEFRGESKPVSEHVIDLVDDLAIMDYRTVAYGADGTIRHAAGELEYAARTGKPAYVALETDSLPDETLIEFEGTPVSGPIHTAPEPSFVAMFVQGDSARLYWVEADSGASQTAATALASDMERAGLDPSAGVYWPSSQRVFVPAEKLSFATLGRVRLRRALEETAREFSRYTSFAGLAIHHSDSYMRLPEGGSR